MFEIAMFVSVMSIDAYYVPRSCLLVLIKHVYESVCGGTCALVGVTGVASAVNVRESSAIHFGIFTLLCCLTRDKLKYHATGDVGVTIATTP